jgi:hypothetical protein
VKSGPCPVFASYTLAFVLQLRKKNGKPSARVVEKCPDIRAVVVQYTFTHKQYTEQQNDTERNIHNNGINVWWRLQIMKSVIVLFYLPSCYALFYIRIITSAPTLWWPPFDESLYAASRRVTFEVAWRLANLRVASNRPLNHIILRIIIRSVLWSFTWQP